MTATLRAKLDALAALVKDMLILGGVLSVILSTISTVVWVMFGDALIKSTGLATMEAVHSNAIAIDDLYAKLAGHAVQQKVVQELPGFTYVVEPVYLDDPDVLLRMVVYRTSAGVSCTVLNIQAVFANEQRVRELSPLPIPVSTQLDSMPLPVDLKIRRPEGQNPGRYVLWLTLQYDCPGGHKFDTTSPVAFYVEETNRPN